MRAQQRLMRQRYPPLEDARQQYSFASAGILPGGDVRSRGGKRHPQRELTIHRENSHSGRILRGSVCTATSDGVQDALTIVNMGS